jgi:hypothetical protein
LVFWIPRENRDRLPGYNAFHNILGILPHQFAGPKDGIVSPPLRVDGDHELRGQGAGVCGGDDIPARMKR